MRSVRRRIRGTKERLGGKLGELRGKGKAGQEYDEDEHTDTHDKTDDGMVKFEDTEPTAESTAVSSGAYVPDPENPSENPTDCEGFEDSYKSDVESKPTVSTIERPLAQESDEEEEGGNEHTFDHPSVYEDQAWIWLPKDPLGLSELLVNDLIAVGINASDVGAKMDNKGIVEVTRTPPDQEWEGGHDA